MRVKEKKPVEVPAIEQVRAERERLRYRRRYRQTLRSTVNVLIVVAALAVLAATVLTPVLQIYGSSMTPTLSEGDIVVSLKGAEFQQGDLIAFYLGNKILVKRCIAGPGQWVDIDPDGTVYVDGKQLDEPVCDRKVVWRLQHRASLSGAGEPVFLHGRPSVHLGGLPAFGGRLCGGGAGCRKNRLESLAACRIRKTFIRWVR